MVDKKDTEAKETAARTGGVPAEQQSDIAVTAAQNDDDGTDASASVSRTVSSAESSNDGPALDAAGTTAGQPAAISDAASSSGANGAHAVVPDDEAPGAAEPAAVAVPGPIVPGAVMPGAAVPGATAGTAASTAASPDEPVPDTGEFSVRPPEEEVNRRAAQRDEAVAAQPAMPRVLQVLVAVFFPIVVLAAAIRAVASPLFLWAEYNRPGFPADSYGFSTEDRITYASYTVDYILNWAPPRYLGDLVNADGGQLFLESEVGHMLDVKTVLTISFAVATAMLAFGIIACVYLARRHPGGVRRALFAGSLATLILMVVLSVTAAVGWQTFFTRVHAIFFADGTWTFSVQDTLIRLFPAQFWIDSAIVVATLVLVTSVVTVICTWPTKARREKSRLAREAVRTRYRQSISS